MTTAKPIVYEGYTFAPGRLQERDLVQAVACYRRHYPDARQIVAHVPAGTQVYFAPPPGVEIRYSEKAQPGKMYLQTAIAQPELFPARRTGVL
jgi:hypothetical protein